MTPSTIGRRDGCASVGMSRDPPRSNVGAGDERFRESIRARARIFRGMFARVRLGVERRRRLLSSRAIVARGPISSRRCGIARFAPATGSGDEFGDGSSCARSSQFFFTVRTGRSVAPSSRKNANARDHPRGTRHRRSTSVLRARGTPSSTTTRLSDSTRRSSRRPVRIPRLARAALRDAIISNQMPAARCSSKRANRTGGRRRRTRRFLRRRLGAAGQATMLAGQRRCRSPRPASTRCTRIAVGARSSADGGGGSRNVARRRTRTGGQRRGDGVGVADDDERRALRRTRLAVAPFDSVAARRLPDRPRPREPPPPRRSARRRFGTTLSDGCASNLRQSTRRR